MQLGLVLLLVTAALIYLGRASLRGSKCGKCGSCGPAEEPVKPGRIRLL